MAPRNSQQIGNIEITQGDWDGLSAALENRLGLQQPEVAELKTSLAKDAKEAPKPSLGRRTAEWLASLGKKSGETMLSVGINVAKKEATKWIFQYLGLPQ